MMVWARVKYGTATVMQTERETAVQAGEGSSKPEL